MPFIDIYMYINLSFHTFTVYDINYNTWVLVTATDFSPYYTLK